MLKNKEESIHLAIKITKLYVKLFVLDKRIKQRWFLSLNMMSKVD